LRCQSPRPSWLILVRSSRNKNEGDMTVSHPKSPGADIQVHYEISGFPPSSEACAVVFVRVVGQSSLRDALVAQAAFQMKTLQDFTPFLEHTLTAKAFVSHQSSGSGRCESSLRYRLVTCAKIIFWPFPEIQSLSPFLNPCLGVRCQR